MDRLVALVRFAPVNSINEPRTLIEACQDGWWYAAPLPQNRVVAAWFTDADVRVACCSAHTAMESNAGASSFDPADLSQCGWRVGNPHGYGVQRERSAAVRWRGLAGGWRCRPLLRPAVRTRNSEGTHVRAARGRYHLDQPAAELYDGGRVRDGGRSRIRRRYGGYFAYYQREQRWPQNVFWKRRGAARMEPCRRAA